MDRMIILKNIEKIKYITETDPLINKFLENYFKYITEIDAGALTKDTKNDLTHSLIYAVCSGSAGARQFLMEINRELQCISRDMPKDASEARRATTGCMDSPYKEKMVTSIATRVAPIIFTYEYEKGKKVEFKYYSVPKEWAEHIFDHFFYNTETELTCGEKVIAKDIDNWRISKAKDLSDAIVLNQGAFLEHYLIPIIKAHQENKLLMTVYYKCYILGVFQEMVLKSNMVNYTDFVKSLDYLKISCENGGFLYISNEKSIIKYYSEIKDQIPEYIKMAKSEPLSMKFREINNVGTRDKDFLDILVEATF